MTPLVAFKESNRPQGRFALADGKLQLDDKSCQARKFMVFGQLFARFQAAAASFSLGHFRVPRVI
jgi:hypothetical protein